MEGLLILIKSVQLLSSGTKPLTDAMLTNIHGGISIHQTTVCWNQMSIGAKLCIVRTSELQLRFEDLNRL